MILMWINVIGREDLSSQQKIVWVIVGIVWGLGPIAYILGPIPACVHAWNWPPDSTSLMAVSSPMLALWEKAFVRFKMSLYFRKAEPHRA